MPIGPLTAARLSGQLERRGRSHQRQAGGETAALREKECWRARPRPPASSSCGASGRKRGRKRGRKALEMKAGSQGGEVKAGNQVWEAKRGSMAKAGKKEGEVREGESGAGRREH
eukprot:3584804-Pleurochrysis_carterae.AAC.1